MAVDSTRRIRWGLALAGLTLLAFLVWTQSGDSPSPRPPAGTEPEPASLDIPVGGAQEEAGGEAGVDVPTIRGEVGQGGNDEPFAGATVTAHARTSLHENTGWPASESRNLTDFRKPGPPVARAISSNDGSFFLRLPHPGTFVVRASKEGLADAADVAATGARVHLTLHGMWKCEFRVIDREDRPVPGATVTVHPTGLNCPPRATAATGPDGRVRVPVATDDVLLVRADGFATWFDESPLDRVDGIIVLRSAWSVAGTVTDVEGRPVEGVAVRLSCWWEELAVTGSDGTFSFDGLTTDTCCSDGERPLVELGFRHPEFLSADRVVVPGERDAGTVLHRPGRAEVRVTLIPPPDLRQDSFYLRIGHPADVALRPVEDPPGTFSLSGVPTGTLRFYAAGMRSRGRPYAVSEANFEIGIRPGDRRLKRAIRLQPKVVSVAMVRVQDAEGRPVRGATVWTDARDFCLTDTDEEGFAWLWLSSPPGTSVALEVAPAWNAPDMDGFVARVVTETCADFTGPVPVVTLAPGRLLTVRVTGPTGQTLPAVASSVLVLQKQGPSDSDDSGRPATPDSVEPHTFRYRVRPERGFGVVVRARGFGVWYRRFPPPGDQDPEVTARVTAEAGLTGRLVTLTGRPVRSVSGIFATILTGPDAPYYGSSTGEIGTDGRFSMAGLARGRIRLTVFESSRYLHSPVAEVEVTLGKDGVTNVGDVVVGQVPVVRGFVRDPDGRPVPGTVVICRERSARKLLARALTQPDGSFELTTPIRPDCVVEFRKDGYGRSGFPLTTESPNRVNVVTITPGK